MKELNLALLGTGRFSKEELTDYYVNIHGKETVRVVDDERADIDFFLTQPAREDDSKSSRRYEPDSVTIRFAHNVDYAEARLEFYDRPPLAVGVVGNEARFTYPTGETGVYCFVRIRVDEEGDFKMNTAEVALLKYGPIEAKKFEEGLQRGKK